jgi:L-2-hydroxyglutarate oxidase
MSQADITIIGAGIIGLAVAKEVLKRFPSLKVLVLEKESRAGLHQSGHNSGVIHSGIYYAPRSCKAELCRAGYKLLIAFCREHGIAFEVCGKIIVATDERELPRLNDLLKRGQANGLSNLRMAGPEELREREPNVTGIAGLRIPETGITDYRAITARLADVCVKHGGEIRLLTRVIGLRNRKGEIVVETTTGEFETKLLINAAGLYSDTISQMAGLRSDISIVPFRGEYYKIRWAKTELVRGLVYAVPNPELPFLGVHFTRKLNGDIEAGPNAVLALRREGYRRTDLKASELFQTLKQPGFWRMSARFWKTGFAELRRSWSKQAFCKSLQRLVPELTASDLQYAGAGVRAQAINKHGMLLDDFEFVLGDRAIHVLNVPSPAATASLAIAEHIVNKAEQTFSISNRRCFAVPS